jgi:hypothetical protein
MYLAILIERVGSTYSASRSLNRGQKAIVEDARRRAFRKGREPQEKQRFANAQRLVRADPTGRLIYVKGYVDGWLHHGWAALDGVVIDPTLEGYTKYAGLPFSRDYVRERARSHTATLLDDWQRHWPVLTEAKVRDRAVHPSVRARLAEMPLWVIGSETF